MRPPRFSRLRASLLLVVLVAVVPSLLFILQTAQEHRRLVASAAQERALDMARDIAGRQKDLIESTRNLLAGLSESALARQGGQPCETRLSGLMNRYYDYTLIGVANRAGDTICSAPSSSGQVNVADRVWFKDSVLSHRFSVGEYQIGRVTGKATLGMGYPVLGADNEVEVVMFAGLDLSKIGDAFEAHLPPESTLTVTDRSGLTLFRYPDHDRWIGQVPPEDPVIAQIRSGGRSNLYEAQAADGAARLYALTALGPEPLNSGFVTIGVPSSVIYAEVDRALNRDLGGLGLVTLLAVATAWFGTNVLILRRVKALLAATRRLTGGDLTARTGLPKGFGEISQLAEAFDRMAEALDERLAETGRITHALQQREEQFRSLIENISDMILLVNDQAVIIYASPSSERVLGYEPDELVNQKVFDLLHPEDVGKVKSLFGTNLHLYGKTEVTELRRLHKDGSWRTLEGIGRPVPSASGRVNVIVTLRDITARKLAEESLRKSEEQYRDLFESNPHSMWVFDLETLAFLAVNDAAIHQYGYSRDEFLAMTIKDIRPSEDVSGLLKAVKIIRENGGLAPSRISRHTKRDGTVITAEVTSHVIEFAGRRAQLVLANDVTERKRIREERSRLVAALEIATDFVAIMSANGELLYLNGAARKLAGIGRDEDISGITLAHLISDKDHLHTLQSVVEEIIRNGAWSGNLTLHNAEGGETPVLMSGQAHNASDGRLQFISAIARDVTDWMRAEQLIKESEEKYKTIVELATDLIYTSDKRGNLTFMNDAGYMLLDASPGDVAGQSWLKWVHPDDRKESARTFRKMLRQANGVFDFEHRLISRNGAERFVVSNMRVLWDKSGSIAGVQGISHDITARRKAEQELRESEARLRSVTESSVDAIITANSSGKIVFWNQAAGRMFGFENDEIVGKPLALLVPADSQSTVSATVERMTSAEDIPFTGNSFEQQAVRKDGSMFPAEVTHAAWETQGERFFTAIVRDISERRREDEVRQASEKRFRSLIEHSSDSILLLDASGKVSYASPSTERISGYSLEQFAASQSIFELIDPGDRDTAMHALAGIVGNPNGPVNLELRGLNSSGRSSWIEATVTNMLAEPSVQAVVVNWRDITGRKRNEEQLQRHVQRLFALRNIDMIITSSLDLRVTLNVVVDQVIAQLHVDAADVLLFSQEAQRLEFATGRGFRTRALQHTRLRLGEGHAGKAALERRVKAVPSLVEDPGEMSLAPLLANELFVTYYGVPLVAKGQIKGVLEIFHRSHLKPEPDWLDFLEILAGQAAIALDNATLFEDLQRSNLEMAVAYDTTLEGWVRALDLRDKETEGHSQRVTEMAVELARAVGLSEAEVAHVRRGALLHDIGKTAIPDSILLKHDKLSEDDWKIMRLHPVYAHEFLSPISFLGPATEIPYCHHEKWDGSGYPRGIRGEDIPLSARIFAVVDVWDALRSDRVYRPAWPEDKARKYIKINSGSHFDPKVAEAFLQVVGKTTTGSDDVLTGVA